MDMSKEIRIKCIFYTKRITEFTYEMYLLRETYYRIYGTYFLSFPIFEYHKFNDKFRQTLIASQFFSQEFTRNYLLRTIFENSLFACDNISSVMYPVYFMIQ